MITTNDAFPSRPELIIESEDRDALKERAESLAKEFYGLLEPCWVFKGNDQDWTELTVPDRCNFVIRSW